MARHRGVPRGDRTRKYARELDIQKRRLDFLRRYMDLYREYAAGRAVLRRRQHAGAAPVRSTATTRRSSPSTPRSSTGSTTSKRCTARASPSRCADSTSSARSGTRRWRSRPARSRRCSRPTRARCIAAFDMDGTLLSSNVIETYLWMRLPELDGPQRVGEIGADAAPAAEADRGRAQGPRHLPAHDLPPVRRCGARGTEPDRRRGPGRARARAAQRRRRTTDP